MCVVYSGKEELAKFDTYKNAKDFAEDYLVSNQKCDQLRIKVGKAFVDVALPTDMWGNFIKG